MFLEWYKIKQPDFLQSCAKSEFLYSGDNIRTPPAGYILATFALKSVFKSLKKN